MNTRHHLAALKNVEPSLDLRPGYTLIKWRGRTMVAPVNLVERGIEVRHLNSGLVVTLGEAERQGLVVAKG